MFVDQLKNKIAALSYGGQARNLLKVVLGEIQQKAAFKEVSDQQCHSMVKKMIKANEDNIKLLDDGDRRKEEYHRENVILSSLLPQYWSEQDIRNWIQDEKIDVNAFPNEGAVIGQCMSKLKGEPVEGGMVKKIISEMRADG
tara:strand:+ start:199 stop:624 length:426 start_codon:yes stop_codon:yes gene_type:complete